MKPIEIKKNTLIPAGNFFVSIGTYKETDVAIFSKSSGEFCQFKHIRKGGKLAKVKRKFKINLCSGTEFCFSFLSKEDTLKLIEMLRK